MTIQEAFGVAYETWGNQSPEFCRIKDALETLAARVRELEAATISGQCVEIGNDDSGQPMLLIHATREEIKQHGSNLLFQKVKVRLA